jgi:starch phosphorylase
VFTDAERLARILNASGRPVQIIFAGKSHPADDIGKHHLQRVFRRALDPAFGGRVAFVDDYDLHVAHFLVQGCDLWLNTPRKPLEASGTSAHESRNQRRSESERRRWMVGRKERPARTVGDRRRRAADNPEAADAADANARSTAARGRNCPGLLRSPRRQYPAPLDLVREESIRTVAPRFCARRMLKEYVERMYRPALHLRM